MSTADNRKVVEAFWQALYERDFANIGKFFSEDALYQDIPFVDQDPGAVGPVEVEKRLRLGLEPLTDYVHNLDRIVCEGDNVITIHREDWYFETGEVVKLPFVSVQEVKNGKITRWRDFFDSNTLMSGAPKWWIDSLANASYK